MEKSTIVGIILGLIAVLLGMFLKNAPLVNLVNPAAFVIILVGTAASLFIGFPLREISKIPKLLRIVFIKQKMVPRTELISWFTEWAMITRREGLLALETKIEDIPDGFLRNGMRMVIDGNDQDFVRDVLLDEITATQERHKAGALIFSQAGMYAPTLGVLGAVIGLIAALSEMDDMNKLAKAIAAAFVATLLGIFTGYVLWHPISNKLKRLSKKESEIRLMMVEGLLSIQAGVSAIAIEQKLSVYLSPAERRASRAAKETDHDIPFGSN